MSVISVYRGPSRSGKLLPPLFPIDWLGPLFVRLDGAADAEQALHYACGMHEKRCRVVKDETMSSRRSSHRQGASSARGRARDFRHVCVQAGYAIRDYAMIGDGDRLLVGLSGGADSMILMHVLHYLQRRAPVRFEVFSATVDMQFAGVDLEGLTAYCQRQGWHLHVESLEGQRLIEEKSTARRPCALCSRLRRGCLHAVADRLGCNKLVLGQQLDDLCVSLLMSLCRGGGLKTMGPHVPADAATKELIRPLCYVTKARVHRAADELGVSVFKSCPYEAELAEHGDRARFERLLTQLADDIPDLRRNMLASMQRVEPDHLLDRRFIELLKRRHD